MCTASQANVLVPQGYGSILARIIIINKGFIKHNMSWAFGSSCPWSRKHKFKSGGRQTPYPASSLRFQAAGNICDSVRAHVYAETAGTSPLSVSLHAPLMLFLILSLAELRGT